MKTIHEAAAPSFARIMYLIINTLKVSRGRTELNVSAKYVMFLHVSTTYGKCTAFANTLNLLPLSRLIQQRRQVDDFFFFFFPENRI